MPMSKGKNAVIVTTFGVDGAGAAALLVRRYPEAQIVITSASRVAATLARIADGAKRGTGVHLCGVGLGDDPAGPLAALAGVAATGAEIVWYCGRGYLDEFAAELAPHCTPVLKHCRSNTEAVFRYLQPSKDRTAALLLELAAEFAARQKDLPPDHAWLHDYVEASAARYFKYDDPTAFAHCIRKLAGLEEFTPRDRKEVEGWRAGGGKALPLGNSPAMKRVRAMIARLGPVEEPVLVLGPSGAGKEMVARLLHETSARADGPFVPVNCAILSTSSDLASDRLFGHKAGAYTGATKDGKGAFEVADGGTLFLDEAGELPLEAQTQLLRVLEEGTVMPLGTMEPRRVNVRVVAATNRDLPRMVEEGAFRLDLYHRLNVLTLTVPELRQRKEDMPAIANAVIHRLREKGYSLKLAKSDWDAAYAYDWPGNIRQFQNILKRAAYLKMSVAEVVAEEAQRTPAGKVVFAPGTGGAAGGRAATPVWPQNEGDIRPFDEMRKAYLRRCLELCEGNWTLAARRMELAVNTLRNALLDPQ